MANRYWWSWIKRTLATIIAAALAGAIIHYFTRSDYDTTSWLQVALVSVGIYIAASFLMGLVEMAGGVIYITALSSGDFEQAILTDLRNSNLPPPDDWQPKRWDYLAMLADDEEADVNDRVKAALLYNTIKLTSKHAGFFRGMALDSAADRAVLRYAEEAPRK